MVARLEGRHDVIIIGAGIAGLSAANRLKHYGYDVIILEYQNRIGGRMWTKKDLGVPLDVGAAWICGLEGNPIYTLAKKYHADPERTKENDASIQVYDDKGKKVGDTTLKNIGKIWERLMKFVDAKDAKDSRWESLGEVFKEYLGRMRSKHNLSEQDMNDLNYGRSLLENDWGASINQLSAKLWDHIGYILPGGQDVCKNGYETIVDGLAERIGKERILLNNIVVKIDYDKNRVRVTTRENKIFEGKYAICTLPVGVLFEKHNQLFSPSLPQKKIDAMKYIRMGNFHKTFLKFKEPFWEKGRQWINRVSPPAQEGRWNQFLSLEKETDKVILVGINQAAYAEELDKKGKDEIKEEALGVLRGIYGDKTPRDCDVMVTTWSMEEYSRGAYSYTAKGAPSLEVYEDLAAPIPLEGEKRVFFAGEATTKYYPATVHGAYMTGLREANRLYRYDTNSFLGPEEQQLDWDKKIDGNEKDWQVFPEQVIPPPGRYVIAHAERDDPKKTYYRPVFAERIEEGKEYRAYGKVKVGGKEVIMNGENVTIDNKEWVDARISTPDDYFP